MKIGESGVGDGHPGPSKKARFWAVLESFPEIIPVFVNLCFLLI
jgi:hypothetical protein